VSTPAQDEKEGEGKMEATGGQLEWSRLYYDGVEHLLWNPDWIKWQKPDGTRRTVRAIMQKLSGLEAPLHHAVQMFLTLAPTEFVARVLQIDTTGSALQVACCKEWEKLKLTGGKTRNPLELCEPDIFVESAGWQIAVEVKAKSKSNLEQVLKYAALMLLRTRTTSTKLRGRLVLLAPYESFADFWPQRAYADTDSLREGLQKFGDPKTDAKFRGFGLSLDEVKASLDDFEITWRSVRDVRREVTQELKRVAALEPMPAREVYRKLLSGFENELRRWQGGE
jgi:hypothetical protein